jgi:epoxyqueuosine reductase
MPPFQPRSLSIEAFATNEPEKGPRPSLFAPALEWLASLTQQQFSASFRKSAVKRAKWRGLVRNACVALGNSHIARDSEEYVRVLRMLEKLAANEDAILAEHASWALGRLKEPRPNSAAGHARN